MQNIQIGFIDQQLGKTKRVVRTYQITTKWNWDNKDRSVSEFKPLFKNYDQAKIQEVVNRIDLPKGYKVMNVQFIRNTGFGAVKVDRIKVQNNKIIVPQHSYDVYNGYENDQDEAIYGIIIHVTDSNIA